MLPPMPGGHRRAELAVAGGVQLAATGRQRHPPRDVSHLQLRRRVLIIALPADQLDKALACQAEGETPGTSATSPRRPMVSRSSFNE